MRKASTPKRPGLIVAVILVLVAGALGIAIGLMTGNGTVVGLSGGLAGVVLSLLMFGHLLGTE